MVSKFMDTLKLEHDGRLLDICGPITWGAGEDRMEMRVAVQQGRSVAGAWSSPGTFFTAAANPDEWEFDGVVLGRRMRAGPAIGFAWAKVFDAGGNVLDEQNWWQQVTIV
jgi:hypothetical protein